MKITDLSTKVLEFTGKNSDLEQVTDDGIFIRIVELDGWLRVMLEIGEYVTNPSTALRNAAPLAQLWLNRLLEFQGAWWGGGDNQGFEMLSIHQENGQSYKELASSVNLKIAKYLQEYLVYRDEIEKRFPEYKSQHEENLYYHIFSLDLRSSPSTISHAHGLLRMFGLEEDEITEILKDGIAQIKAGQEPFAPGYPISGSKMREIIRTWRQGKKHKSIKAQEIKPE